MKIKIKITKESSQVKKENSQSLKIIKIKGTNKHPTHNKCPSLNSIQTLSIYYSGQDIYYVQNVYLYPLFLLFSTILVPKFKGGVPNKASQMEKNCKKITSILGLIFATEEQSFDSLCLLCTQIKKLCSVYVIYTKKVRHLCLKSIFHEIFL